MFVIQAMETDKRGFQLEATVRFKGNPMRSDGQVPGQV
jgi:hypothetical protein